MVRTSGIYMIKNTDTGKVYIGSAVDIQARWREHRWQLKHGFHHSIYLQRANDKYGESSFEFSIIEEVPNESLLIREQHWLDHFQSYKYIFGYNICRMARNSSGYRHTDESIRKMRETRRKYVGENHPMYGRRHTEETKCLISANRKGKCVGELHHQYGKIRSQEWCRKISESNRGKVIMEDQRRKMSAAHKGKHVGDNNNNAVLNVEMVRAIKMELRDGVSCKELSSRYGVTVSNIYAIKNGYSWKHITIDDSMTS